MATTDQSEAAVRLRDAMRRLIVAHGALDEVRRPCGTPLSVPHAWALLELRASGALTVTALAERLAIDRTNVSRLCARMESLGEVERTVDPSDARARVVRLTEHGARVAHTVDTSSARHFAAVLDRLDGEAAAATDLLEALSSALLAQRTLPRDDP